MILASYKEMIRVLDLEDVLELALLIDYLDFIVYFD